MPMMRKPAAFGCLVLGLLLCAGPAAALTREVRMHGPNGNGGSCPETSGDSTPVPTDGKPATPAKPSTRSGAGSGTHTVIPTVRGSSGGGASHAPRWHSFLPGMFR